MAIYIRNGRNMNTIEETRMRLNTLGSEATHNVKRRLGRGIGSGRGKTCGKGHKGQKARSGARIPKGFEGGQMPLYRRLPKFGFNSRKARERDEIRLPELSKIEGNEVNLMTLRAAGLINANIKRAKIILQGKVERAFTIQKDVEMTNGARAAIEAAGGRIEE